MPAVGHEKQFSLDLVQTQALTSMRRKHYQDFLAVLSTIVQYLFCHSPNGGLPFRSSPTGKFPRVPSLVFGTAEIRIWHHFHWSAFVAMTVLTQPKVEITLHFECKLHFPSAQLMLRQMHLANVSESIEVKYWVSSLSFNDYQAWIRAMKTAALEFVVLSSKRLLHIEVRVQKTPYFCGVLPSNLLPSHFNSQQLCA